MRVVIRYDVSDEEREAIAWDLDDGNDANGWTEGGTYYRKRLRKRLAKRTEVADYIESYGLAGLESLGADWADWCKLPTLAEAEA